MMIFPTLNYGPQTWSMTKRTKRKLIRAHKAMERAILNIKKINQIRTQKIQRKLLNRKDFIQTIRNQYWNWAGHVIRLQDNR